MKRLKRIQNYLCLKLLFEVLCILSFLKTIFKSEV